MAAKIIDFTSRYRFVGTWAADGDGVTEWTVRFVDNKIVVSGVDTEDGEHYEVSDVVFDGEILHWAALMPRVQLRS